MEILGYSMQTQLKPGELALHRLQSLKGDRVTAVTHSMVSD
jgi:hypothetical protein